MSSSSDHFAHLFKTFERQAFRLESLDNYITPAGAANLRAFLAGDPKPDEYNSKWLGTVRAATESGKRMYRVHILTRPLTPYLRYELGWGYITNMTAGEEFFILDTTEQQNPLDEILDFWMFDERTPVIMHYDETGAFSGPELLPGERATEFITYRDTAMAGAVPFPEWWAKYGG